MSTIVKAGLAAVSATALLFAPGVASAAYTFSDLTLSAPTLNSLAHISAVTTTMARTNDFFEASTPALSIGQAGGNQADLRHDEDIDGMNNSPSVKALATSDFGNLRGDASLLLWNLCAVVRAQQGRHAFDLIDNGIQTVKISEDIAKVSAVPLPGAMWLFIMGAMGIAGARLLGFKKLKNVVDTDPSGEEAHGWRLQRGAMAA